MIKKHTIILFFAFAWNFGFAQPTKIAFEKYGVAEGLPEELVSDVVQDDKGFIWCSTQNGLVKYDGYKFNVYKKVSDKNDTTGLQLRNLNGGLIKGADGNIWMGEGLGDGVLSSFDPQTGKFTNYHFTGEDAKIKNSSNYLKLEDHDGNLWFRSLINHEYFLACLHPKTKVMRRYTIKLTGFALLKLGQIAESYNGIWALAKNGDLNKWNIQTDSFQIVLPSAAISSEVNGTDSLRTIMKGKENRLLITGKNGLYIYDTKSQKIIHRYANGGAFKNKLTQAEALYAIEDFNGQYWVFHEG